MLTFVKTKNDEMAWVVACQGGSGHQRRRKRNGIVAPEAEAMGRDPRAKGVIKVTRLVSARVVSRAWTGAVSVQCSRVKGRRRMTIDHFTT